MKLRTIGMLAVVGLGFAACDDGGEPTVDQPAPAVQPPAEAQPAQPAEAPKPQP